MSMHARETMDRRRGRGGSRVVGSCGA